MIKNIFFFLGITFCTFLIVPAVHACDPLGCLFNGHEQATLILGEVIATANDTLDVKVIFVFPQNKVDLKEGDKITVKNNASTFNLTNAEAGTTTIGKKYLLSLNKKDNVYVIAWGGHEVIGTTYSDARLVENRTGDDAALQIFINSGGTERDFYFNDKTAFWRPNNGQNDIQIFPVINDVKNKFPESEQIQGKEKNIIWYVVGIGVLALGGVILISRKK